MLQGRISGVAYALSHSNAVQKGWRVNGARPEGRAGQFVTERPDHTGAHEYITPAILGPVFRVRSTVPDTSDTESWRTDTQQTAEAPAFPNLDIILANAQTSPEEFVQCFVDQGGATNTTAVGPLAPLVQ